MKKLSKRRTPKPLTAKARKGDSSEGSRLNFPIVGIGASAGGLEAFTELLKALPPDTGMAFVFIQHLDPQHESMLGTLLSRTTSMPVIEARHGMRVQPDHAYVIPANVDLSLADGKLSVVRREPTVRQHLPVDHFFKTLAETQDARAIGIILSGAASDGTLGLKAIKVAGGITFAQQPETAKFDGMPKSAISSGSVDFVLPPDQIAAELVYIAHHPLIGPEAWEKTPALIPPQENEWVRIFELLKELSEVDFTLYKKPTISRRVGRRMALHKIEALGEYVRYLQGDRKEVDALYHDILIHVTSFFRDPEVFRALRKQVLPELLAQKPPGDAIRIWAPGCSSGEEVYSIAICLLEVLGDRAARTPIQIFGSDISEQDIEKARLGIYSTEALKDVSRDRVHQFFFQVDGHYRVNSAVRDICLFSRHDLTKDPPFSRLDLISCRNVLIYFEPILQKRVLTSFHYALKDTGVLLLGKSENLGGYPDLFTPKDQKNKFFTKKPAAGTIYIPSVYESLRHQEKPSLAKLSTFDLEKEADRALWEHSHYAGLVVDDDLQILHFRGDTSPYLRPVPGKATFNLLRMLREELVFELRKTINTTRETRSTVRKNGIRMKRNGDIHSINIEVRPLPTRRSSDHYFLILFEDAAGRGPREPQAEEAASAEPVVERKKKINKEVIELKSELARTRDYLQAVIQEQETTNEELKVANEEAQSSMEELQSTNEELETAKEELQSSNEELVTLNEQLQKRNNELGRLSDDLSNVLGGVNIPILLLGADRRIRRFTPSAEKTLHLLAGDIGRPVSNLRTGINIPDLDALIETVMDSLSEARREVHADDGRWYFVRIRPFLTADRKVDGVLIAFVDIQEIKEAQERLQREQQLSAAILDAAKDLLVLVLDRDGRIVQFNHACQETTGYSFEDVRGRRFWEFLPIREEKAQVKAGFEETLKGKRTHGETHWLTKNGQPRLVAWSNVLALSASGRVDNVVRTGVDVTKREEAEERAHESDAAINALLETAPQAVLAHDQDERIVLVNAAAEAMFGYSRHEMTGQPLAMLIPERFRSRHKKHVKGFFKDPHIRPMGLGLNLFGVRKDGSEFPVEIGLSFFKTRTGVLAVSFISDTTERKRSEGMLLQYQKELQTLTGRLLEIQESGNKELARELHDDLSQKLAAVGMEVSTLVQSSVGSSDSLPARIRALSARINSLTEDVHALSRRLHPAILDELGLEAALKEECVRFSALVGVPAQCESESVPRSIPENVSQCFYRIVQEGLRNVTKHAKATRARVLLSGTVDGIALRVEDNGNGFAVDRGKGEGGLGLISMEERVRLVNGRFNIKSMPGEGTTIDVFVPLKAK